MVNLLTQQKCAEALGIPVSLLVQWRSSGLPHTRPGGNVVFYDISDVKAWIEARMKNRFCSEYFGIANRNLSAYRSKISGGLVSV